MTRWADYFILALIGLVLWCLVWQEDEEADGPDVRHFRDGDGERDERGVRR